MPKLSLSGLLRRVGERPESAIVFLHGPEEYRRERAVQLVVDALLDPATAAFNFDQLRGGDATPEGLGSLLATPPMMAEHRVIIIREVQGLSPKTREAIEQVVTNPYPGLVLVLVATIPSGSKAKFYDTLRAAALTVEFPTISADDLPGWIIEHAAEMHSVGVEVDAARAWAAAIGPELGVLATEVEKAVAYVGDRQRIRLEDVKTVGGYIPRVNRWGWLDLVGERRFAEALDQLPELLDSGETAVGLVLALGGQFLKLGMLVDGGRDGLERNIPSNQRWLIGKLESQARKWSLDQVDRGLSDLLRSDRLLKSASLGDRQVLEELLLRLAADGPSSREKSGGPAAANVLVTR